MSVRIGWLNGSPPTDSPAVLLNTGNKQISGVVTFFAGIVNWPDSVLEGAITEYAIEYSPIDYVPAFEPYFTDDGLIGIVRSSVALPVGQTITTYIRLKVNSVFQPDTLILSFVRSFLGDGIYNTYTWTITTEAVSPGAGAGVPVGIQKLLEPPDETGYSITEAQDSLLSVDVYGGSPRTRLDFIGASRFVTLQWSGSKKRWQAVRDFMTQNLALNCPQFNLDLIVASSGYKEYRCNVIPDSIKQSTPVGRYYSIQCTLEVAPRSDESGGWPAASPPFGNESLIFLDNFNGHMESGTINGHTPDIPVSGNWVGTSGMDSGSAFTAGDYGGADLVFDTPIAVLDGARAINIYVKIRAGGDSVNKKFGFSASFNNNGFYIFNDTNGFVQFQDGFSDETIIDLAYNIDVSNADFRWRIAPDSCTIYVNDIDISGTIAYSDEANIGIFESGTTLDLISINRYAFADIFYYDYVKVTVEY